MDAVLGLSMTSCSIGWILLDGPSPDAHILDHDVFDVSVNPGNDGDISRHLAAVRGAQSIAATSGHKVTSIGVTWTEDADAKATLVLRALPELGFDRVNPVRLPDAVRTWARAAGPVLNFEKCAICVVEAAAVTALSFGYDSVRTFANHMRESADGIGRWLDSIFRTNGLEPETVFLIGTRGDLELISGTLEQSLGMRVDASADTQLALAHGTALTLPDAVAAPREPVQKPKTPRWRRPLAPIGIASKASAREAIAKQLGAKEDDLESWTAALKKPAGKAAMKDELPQRVPVEKAPIEVPEAPAAPDDAPAEQPVAPIVADASQPEPVTTPTTSSGEQLDTRAVPDETVAPEPERRRPAWMRESTTDADTFAVRAHHADGEPHRPAWKRTEAEASDSSTAAPAEKTVALRRSWMRPDPAGNGLQSLDKTAVVTPLKTAAAPKKPAVKRAPAAEKPATVAAKRTEDTTEVITLPARKQSPRDAVKAWLGPHARAAAAVVVGLIAVFAVAPFFFAGQKDAPATDQRPASDSASTAGSAAVVPSAPAPPAAVHQVAAEPVPAPLPPPPDAVPPQLATADAAVPVAEPQIEPQSPVTAEPMVAQQAPQSAPVVAAEPAPVAQPPAVPVALPGPAPAAIPEPAAPAPAADVPPPPAPAPPPQDPVMQVLSPLFGALP